MKEVCNPLSRIGQRAAMTSFFTGGQITTGSAVADVVVYATKCVRCASSGTS